MCLLGFLVGMIGSDPISGAERWSFGSIVLFQGLSLVPIMLGIFTFAELIGWARRYDLGAPTLSKRADDDSVWKGIASVFQHWTLSIRSALIGTVVGIIPGVGGTVASFVSYGQAVATTKDKSAQFGKGDIRGVIAPESANDAKDGGSILPVVAFGIPGSDSGVLLLIVFSIHGIIPGIPMLSDQLHLTYTLIFALLLSNILTSVIGLGLAPYLAKLKELRIDLIVLPALLISGLAIVQLDGLYTDLLTASVFGVAGYFLSRHGWPRVPFVIALVLGSFLETNLSLSVNLIELGRIDPFQRPASIILVLMIAVSLWWMTRRRNLEKKVFAITEDLPIALAIASVVAFLAWTAVFNSKPYSTVTYVVVFSTLATVIVIALLSWMKGARALLLTVEPSHRVSLSALILLPILVILFGMVIGFTSVTFFWVTMMSNRTRRDLIKAVLYAALTGLVTYLYVVVIMELYLPQPLALTVLQLF